jgi:hypothetical protein
MATTVTKTDDPRAKRDAARKAAADAESKYGRASHVVQWGGTDAREEAIARRDIYTLKAEAIERRDAAEAAEREYIAASHAEAEGRAPAYRERSEEYAREVHAWIMQGLRLLESGEAHGTDARRECNVAGTWIGERQAWDNSILEPVATVKGIAQAWTQRMRRAGWL